MKGTGWRCGGKEDRGGVQSEEKAMDKRKENEKERRKRYIKKT